jgi:CRISPR-associated protein Cas1
MINRVIDIADRPARLSARGGLLRVELEGEEEKAIPFDHIAALICSHRQTTFTQAAVAEIASAGGLFVVCDAKHLPVGMMLPLIGHGEQTTMFQKQAEAGAALKKRLWRETVAGKILAQAVTLMTHAGQGYGLDHMARRVKVGDATQMEALASRVYWPLLFDDKSYRRSEDEDSRNALLNYGYAIVRAIVARALCGAGLHPGLAIHHHNRYDPYPLANDMMEPFRPLVDGWTARWCGRKPGPWPLDKESKAGLLNFLMGRFTDGEEQRTLFDWVERTAERLARCIEGKRGEIDYPQIQATDGGNGAGPEEAAKRVPGDVADGAV